jgi:hypothetical protein
MKTDGHLGRCHLKGREGDATNLCTVAIGFGHPRARDGAGKALAGPRSSSFAQRACLSIAAMQQGFLCRRSYKSSTVVLRSRATLG